MNFPAITTPHSRRWHTSDRCGINLRDAIVTTRTLAEARGLTQCVSRECATHPWYDWRKAKEETGA